MLTIEKESRRRRTRTEKSNCKGKRGNGLPLHATFVVVAVVPLCRQFEEV